MSVPLKESLAHEASEHAHEGLPPIIEGMTLVGIRSLSTEQLS